MENEVKPIETNETDYISEIQKLKESTVDKGAYDKLLAENRRLISTLSTSPAVTEEQGEAPKPDLQKLGRDFLNAKSDCEIVRLSLEYRDACLALGERDPWLPTSSSYTPTESDIQGMNAYAAVMKDALEKANGNDKLFCSLVEASMPADDPTVSAIVQNNLKRTKQN